MKRLNTMMLAAIAFGLESKRRDRRRYAEAHLERSKKEFAAQERAETEAMAKAAEKRARRAARKGKIFNP